MPLTVALVSCVKLKQAIPAPAGELYTSPLFRGMRQFALRNADRWFVLSAKYGLLDPEQVIAPYEQTLKTARANQRELWAKNVMQAFGERIVAPARVLVLAGVDYRAYLVPMLERADFPVEVPMAALRMGHQLSWLSAQASVNSP